MSQDIPTFSGDLTRMWNLQERQPLQHLTWDWWWWLVMLDDHEGNPSGKQLMVLWSTKDNAIVDVNGSPWTPKADLALMMMERLHWMEWSVHGGLMGNKCTNP